MFTATEVTNLKAVNVLIKKVRFCSNTIRNSTVLRENLKTSQRQNRIPQLESINDVKTRWNSTFLMVDRYIKIHNEVRLVLHDKKYDDIRLSESDLKNLEIFVKLLSHFLDVTIVLSTEVTSTASQVIPMFKLLDNQAKAFQAANDFGRHLQSALIKSIHFYTTKYQIFENLDLITLTFLDPRLKSFRGFPAGERPALIAKAVKHLKEAATTRFHLTTEQLRKNS